jgi:hypothetical protein
MYCYTKIGRPLLGPGLKACVYDKRTCIEVYLQPQTNASASKDSHNNSCRLPVADQRHGKQNIENHETGVLPCIQY